MVRDLLQFCLAENKAWNLTTALLVLLLTCSGLRLLQIVLIRRLGRTAPHPETLLDDVLLDMARRTAGVSLFAIGLAAGAALIDLPPTFAARLHTVLTLIGLVQAGVWGTGLVQYLLVGLLDRRAEPGDVSHRTGKNMLRFIGLAGVWSLVGLLMLENVGVHISTLMAGLSVTGVALALALQPIVGDLMSSIAILLDKPFLVGDYIVCETFSGVIEKIGIRSTRLRALTGEAVVLANFDLARARLRNYKSLRERRQTFTFVLSYDTPTAKAAKVPSWTQDLIKGLPNTRFDRAHLLQLTDLGLQFEVVYYSTVPDYLVFCDAQQAICLGLLGIFDEHGMVLARRIYSEAAVG